MAKKVKDKVEAPVAPEKTAEQIAAEKAAAAAEKAAAAAAKKAEREAAVAAKKVEREAAKAQRAAEREAAKAAKLAEKEAAKAAKEAARMPEQNGVRRPKPNGLCGRAWAIFDDLSAKHGAPAAIAPSLEIAKAEGLNESNVRAEYARWRKFHGITGRIAAPGAVQE